MAGFQPHIVCLGSREEVVEREIGTIHRVVSPFWPRGAIRSLANSSTLAGGCLDSILRGPYGAALHRKALAEASFRLMTRFGGAALLHGFSSWACSALDCAEAFGNGGGGPSCATSFYTTSESETRSRVSGIRSGASPIQSPFFLAERAWVLAVAQRHERRAFRKSDIVLVNYESVRSALERRWGPRREIRVLAYGPDSAFLPKFPPDSPSPPEPAAGLTDPDAPLLVCASRHDPRKGIDHLLRALARLRDEGTRFRACLLGGGPLLEAHRRLAGRLGLDGSTVLTGWVPDVGPYLRAANLFVLPSLQEGSGSIALLEALQAGVAVVASSVDGIPEDVTDGESAILVSPADERALAGALKRPLENATLRSRLGRAGRRVFEERFSAPAFSRALGRIYEEMRNRGRVQTE